MKKLLLLLSVGVGCAFADDTTTAPASGSFTVFPIQVVFSAPGKVQELTLINTGAGVLNTQSKLMAYHQIQVKGKLIESNTQISGAPAVIATPVVISGVKPDAKQSIRLLAIRQDESKEISYRYYIKNLVPQSVDTSGTNFEIQYGMPVFVLPKNVNESYTFSYVKQDGRSYLKIANIGNVHIMFKRFALKDGAKSIDIGTISRLLAGDVTYLEIPAKFATQPNLTVETAKAKLLDFEQADSVSVNVSTK